MIAVNAQFVRWERRQPACSFARANELSLSSSGTIKTRFSLAIASVQAGCLRSRRKAFFLNPSAKAISHIFVPYSDFDYDFCAGALAPGNMTALDFSVFRLICT